MTANRGSDGLVILKLFSEFSELLRIMGTATEVVVIITNWTCVFLERDSCFIRDLKRMDGSLSIILICKTGISRGK